MPSLSWYEDEHLVCFWLLQNEHLHGIIEKESGNHSLNNSEITHYHSKLLARNIRIIPHGVK